MRLLNRYVISQLSICTLYALLVLISLYSFFDIMGEISHVGDGRYTASKMLYYVLLLIPTHAYELMPLAVLVGALVCLNQMASHSEFTVIRTSGIRLSSIISMMLQFGLLFAIVAALMGEYVVPKIGPYAEQYQLHARQNSISAGDSGIWLKQGQDIVNVAEMLPDGSLKNISIYRHDEQFRLMETLHASSANVDTHTQQGKKSKWHLHQVEQTFLQEHQMAVTHLENLDWRMSINHQLLNILLVAPEQMSIMALSTYIKHLKNNHQQTTRYELAWWRKIAYPLACIVMALVALAFTPQQNRHGNMGLKLFYGICLGLLFHFSGRLFGFTSQLYKIPTPIAAFLPTVLFLCLAIYLIRRQEKR
ncbi:LPS export ABC transporter permease LptG [Snodgrassella communis]|uniref:LPS export ABC transporter permease LptG n=1 Tax=Snodgrassella communis TaxID=2946699 RepID=UPI00286C0AC7|nr:LPS export ABC transporter permease LptG [Snodgrassella communis]WMY91388.1 LPS export ABC transporter permease LptG [Snodgrassella communis]